LNEWHFDNSCLFFLPYLAVVVVAVAVAIVVPGQGKMLTKYDKS